MGQTSQSTAKCWISIGFNIFVGFEVCFIIIYLQTFFFSYNFPLIKQGRKHDIGEKDIYKVLPDYEAERLGNKLEKSWKNSKEKSKKASITKCLVRCFGWTYLFYSLVQLTLGTCFLLVTL